MEVLETILKVLIVVSAIILILLTLAQSNKGSDLGLFGGSTDMVFGSQKGNILTRTTAILAFIVIGGSFLTGILRSYIRDADKPIDAKSNVKKVKTLNDLDSIKKAPSDEEAKTETK